MCQNERKAAALQWPRFKTPYHQPLTRHVGAYPNCLLLVYDGKGVDQVGPSSQRRDLVVVAPIGTILVSRYLEAFHPWSPPQSP